MSNNQDNLQPIRHSLAHLLACSVREMYPGAKNAIGPAIENGFYQDFDVPVTITDKDLPKIEKKMREVLNRWKKLNISKKHEVTIDEAKKEFAWNQYKVELIEEFGKEGATITFYTLGDFVDLCKGGHAEDLSVIDSTGFKLTKVAGAYWRGDEKNKMLTRIYGVAFENKEALDKYLAMLSEAEKRDHKVLGPKLDLFTFSELVGSGLPLWTPKGTLVRNLLDDYVWELRKSIGYQKVEIPHITKKELYETSGHWDKFKDDLFKINTRDGHLFAMKPMNCPHHTQIYARKQWSYRELPQRYANTTMVYRDEQSGELSGLSRVLSITQDDAHVFCRFSQAKQELGIIWDKVVEPFYKAVGFPLKLRLSLHDPAHPEKYLGGKERWAEAESSLRELAKARNIEFFEGLGEAAFYGPKLDFLATDSIGRQWQVATVQLDMNMPDRFKLYCIDEQGQHEPIVMLHAAIMGSIERFLSILIEHTAGAFPLWLSPVQVAILPISENQNDYAKEILESLTIGEGLKPSPTEDLRVELDDRSESIGKKIREATMQKVPYLIIVGQKEVDAKQVAVRTREGVDLGAMPLADLIQKLKVGIADKK